MSDEKKVGWLVRGLSRFFGNALFDIMEPVLDDYYDELKDLKEDVHRLEEKVKQLEGHKTKEN